MTKKLTKVYGSIPAMVTPFDEKGAIDVVALKKLIKFLVSGGIDAIVPCGSTGEAATMSLEEYELVVKTTVEVVGGKIPVIAGAGSNDTQKAILFSQIAKAAGADGLLHVTPYYNKPTVDGLVAHYKAIAKAVDLPIVVYNVPGRTGLNLTADACIRIAKEVPKVIAVKEASGNISQMMDIIAAAPKGFSVLSGDDALTLPLIAAGGVGIISVVANEVPSEFSKMVHFALAGNFKKARELHYRLLPLMNGNFIETNPIPVKTALFMMGKIKESFRLPLVPMSAKNKEALKLILKDLRLI
ncbi:MAG TPA: 4-hydroxy-tetrahydrodipicolinate synthase [Candidatus Saccharimonadales bacterium]|nr:4-hydroxy-tetrahydrodipicolinate synthase [Candidatus Saccharimonadales bacterium]